MKTDIATFLNHYKKTFTNSGLEKVTGLSQQQINLYSTGNQKPSVEELKKIETNLHNFGKELLAVNIG